MNQDTKKHNDLKKTSENESVESVSEVVVRTAAPVFIYRTISLSYCTSGRSVILVL